MLCFGVLSKESAYIVYKIDNEIITNIDIEKEYQYLSTLNTQLKDLDKNQVLEISKESALREKIKKIELSKYFEINTTVMDNDINIVNITNNQYIMFADNFNYSIVRRMNELD